MDKVSFIKKNLITYYRDEFISVWNLSEQSSKEKLNLMLKELDNDVFIRNAVVTDYLSSNDLFTNFVGAYLSIAFGVSVSAGILAFKNIMRLYKKSSPSSLEGRLCFYIQTIADLLDEQGFITAYEGQKTVVPLPLTEINALKST